MAILSGWLYFFACHSRPRVVSAPTEVLSLVCVLASCAGLFLAISTVLYPKEASPRTQSMSRLRQVALGLFNYATAAQGSFPPAYTIDEGGNRLHSWRARILGLLSSGPSPARMWDFEQPWNSPANRAMQQFRPQILRDPRSEGQGDEPDTHTSYVAVVGAKTAWPGNRGRKLDEITDGLEHTILLIEIHTTHIHWAEPRDLTLDEALDVLTSNDPRVAGAYRTAPWFFYEHEYVPETRNVVFADGHADSIPHGVDRQTWKQLLTIDDGVPAEGWDAVSTTTYGKKNLRIGNCCRFAVFVVLALMPLPWVWRHLTTTLKPTADTPAG